MGTHPISHFKESFFYPFVSFYFKMYLGFPGGMPFSSLFAADFGKPGHSQNIKVGVLCIKQGQKVVHKNVS